jgi:hypothetical protein
MFEGLLEDLGFQCLLAEQPLQLAAPGSVKPDNQKPGTASSPPCATLMGSPAACHQARLVAGASEHPRRGLL